jgi:hypothetical protein
MNEKINKTKEETASLLNFLMEVFLIDFPFIQAKLIINPQLISCSPAINADEKPGGTGIVFFKISNPGMIAIQFESHLK